MIIKAMNRLNRKRDKKADAEAEEERRNLYRRFQESGLASGERPVLRLHEVHGQGQVEDGVLQREPERRRKQGAERVLSAG